MGKVSNAEVERRHQLEQQRATLQDELSKTYTVRVFRGACLQLAQGWAYLGVRVNRHRHNWVIRCLSHVCWMRKGHGGRHVMGCTRWPQPFRTIPYDCHLHLSRLRAEYVQERNVREPMVMANVTAASDGVIRARNAHHTLRENRAAGSRSATDAIVSPGGQSGPGEGGKTDPYLGLTGGVRFLADGIRPSDLDIDEIIAPEMREMVSCSSGFV